MEQECVFVEVTLPQTRVERVDSIVYKTICIYKLSEAK